MSATTTSLRLNLLPEARLAKLRAQRQRQLSATIATVICSVCAGLVVIAFAVTLAQSKHIGDLKKQITSAENDLYSHKDLNDIITLQQHLKALPDLYKQRAYMTRFFTIVQAVSPNEISINTVTYDNVSNTLTVSGHGKSFASVDKLVKVIEGGNPAALAPDGSTYFSNVSIDGVSSSGKQTSFNITMTVSSEATANPAVTPSPAPGANNG